MTHTQANNPLHGVTLETLLTELVARYGWDGLARQVNIRCFTHEPSIASSLKFLRRTPWARARVEEIYVDMLRHGHRARGGKEGKAMAKPKGKTQRTMSYEQHLDEVTTLITEKYDVADEDAIAMVMRAQEDEFFSGHDDDTSICTLDRAHEDARTVFKRYGSGGR